MSITRRLLSGIVRLVSAAILSTALMSASLMTTASFGACAESDRGTNGDEDRQRSEDVLRHGYFTSTSSMAMRSGPSIMAARSVAPRVNLFEELDAFALQPRHRRPSRSATLSAQ